MDCSNHGDYARLLSPVAADLACPGPISPPSPTCRIGPRRSLKPCHGVHGQNSNSLSVNHYLHRLPVPGVLAALHKRPRLTTPAGGLTVYP